MDSLDAVQEVELRALRNKPEFANEARRRGWLMVVLRNVLFSEGRRHAVVAFDSGMPEPVDGHGSPSAGARAGEEARYALDLLRVLPERDRRVVELRVLEGRPFNEVASVLDLKCEGHARVLFQRSMAKLRDRSDSERDR
jgi:RNA polymerase sigma factor (sigma-70 family)